MIPYVALTLAGLYIAALTIYAFGIKGLSRAFRPGTMYFVELHDWSRNNEFPKLYKLEFFFDRWPTVPGLIAALDSKRAEVETWNLPKQAMLTLIDRFKDVLKLADRNNLAEQGEKPEHFHWCDHAGGLHIFDGDNMVAGIGIYTRRTWR